MTTICPTHETATMRRNHEDRAGGNIVDLFNLRIALTSTTTFNLTWFGIAPKGLHPTLDMSIPGDCKNCAVSEAEATPSWHNDPHSNCESTSLCHLTDIPTVKSERLSLTLLLDLRFCKFLIRRFDHGYNRINRIPSGADFSAFLPTPKLRKFRRRYPALVKQWTTFTYI